MVINRTNVWNLIKLDRITINQNKKKCSLFINSKWLSFWAVIKKCYFHTCVAKLSRLFSPSILSAVSMGPFFFRRSTCRDRHVQFVGRGRDGSAIKSLQEYIFEERTPSLISDDKPICQQSNYIQLTFRSPPRNSILHFN